MILSNFYSFFMVSYNGHFSFFMILCNFSAKKKGDLYLGSPDAEKCLHHHTFAHAQPYERLVYTFMHTRRITACLLTRCLPDTSTHLHWHTCLQELLLVHCTCTGGKHCTAAAGEEKSAMSCLSQPC